MYLASRQTSGINETPVRCEHTKKLYVDSTHIAGRFASNDNGGTSDVWHRDLFRTVVIHLLLSFKSLHSVYCHEINVKKSQTNKQLQKVTTICEIMH